ncbi:uncharacterized protein LOC122646196 [Telopea speciosissima]|uniref:uncharacterized protein LOC122646196 n=1 Tax=Telopea speciosissima TaxID=54955 RepID=UPI001CC3D526|nr:uncharacterized protein LOC122646196 [Telopea speciosissima]
MGNFICKVLSKILALRLAGVHPHLISEEQREFQKEKVIFDNISLASKLTNLFHKVGRGGGVGLKIDIQKANDTLSWDFLLEVMMKFGFSEVWVRWMYRLLVTTCISVLVNGGPVGFFGVKRGLR